MRHRIYLGIIICLCAVGASTLQGAEVNTLSCSPANARSTEHVAVTPTVSDLPEGKSFLCWALYSDADCTHEVADVPFRIDPSGSANTVRFTPPTQGTYYIQAVIKNGGATKACDKTIVATKVQPIQVYPNDAEVVLVRTDQEAGSEVDLTADEGTKQVYGVLRFAKSSIADEEKSAFERFNYFISFPFDVQVSDITGLGTYGREWMVSYYDGLGRAQNGYWADSNPNWKRINDTDSILHANQGYLLQLNTLRTAADQELWESSDVQTLYFPSLTKVTVTQTNETIPALSSGYTCTIEGREDADSNWRCIGVPSYSGTWSTEDILYFYTWNMEDNKLSVTSAEGFAFQPMHAYLIQNNAQIVWSKGGASSIIARKRDIDKREWRLDLLQDSNFADRTFVQTRDEHVSAAFDVNYDLSKEFNSGANLYTLIGSERVAANCLPTVTNETKVIPLGLRVTEDGNYSIRIETDVTDQTMSIVDHTTGTRTHLQNCAYTVSLSAGTYENRWSLEISNTPTSIDAIQRDDVQSTKVRKIWHEGELYILKDNTIFDARGNKLQKK